MKMIYYWFCCCFCLLAFYHINAQTIIKQDGWFGLADEKGNIVVKAEFDTIWPLKNYTNTFFVLEKNKKLGYCYKVELDSIKWIPEAQRYWITSAIEFDRIITKVVGSPAYSGSFTYTSIAYKKNGLWGIMFVQTRTGSGDGIFPSAGFYVEGFGHLRIREAKYDSIYRIDRDAFYTTRLNGKYGFWEPTTNEVYEPEFDSIPIPVRDYKIRKDITRQRYAKKNGKWGIIYLNDTTKKIEYKVPCLCNGLGMINEDFYYCMGQNDTLKIYYTKTQQTFTPLIDGKPIRSSFYWRAWEKNEKFSFQEYIGKKNWVVGTDSMYYNLDIKNGRYIILEKEKNRKEIFPVITNNFQNKTTISVYVIDMQKNKMILSFTDTTCSYFSGYESLIVKAHYDDKKKYTREFYDDQTGVLKFSITTPEQFLHMDDIKKDTRRGQTTWYKFISSRSTSSDHGAVRGYYNLTTKKFSRFRR